MRKTFIVIGLGRFGSNVARTLVQMNCDVLAVDIDEDCVSQISKDVPHCVIADATKESVLTELGVSTIDHAVVAIGNNLQASILTIVNLRKLGVKRITARADVEGHREVYMTLGATDVIIPEEASAVSLANQIISDSFLDYYPLTGSYAIVKLTIRNEIKENLKDLDLRNNYDVNIIGMIKKSGEFFIPRGTDTLNVGEVAVVVGTRAKVKKFDEFLNS